MSGVNRGGMMRSWMVGPVALGMWLLCGLQLVQAQAATGAGVAAANRPAARGLLQPVSPAMQALAGRVLGLADHGQRPFAIVDKQAALLAVYRADGTLAAVSPALLGRDLGDLSVPGVGERAQTGRLLPGDATTPGGRFVSSPGRNRFGEAVVWVDFSAAFAIHRLRPGASQPERARRLASINPRHKRLSAGCVVVPTAFYQAVVGPLLGRSQATVYVLPESPQGWSDWHARWQALALPSLATATATAAAPASVAAPAAAAAAAAATQTNQAQEIQWPAV